MDEMYEILVIIIVIIIIFAMFYSAHDTPPKADFKITKDNLNNITFIKRDPIYNKLMNKLIDEKSLAFNDEQIKTMKDLYQAYNVNENTGQITNISESVNVMNKPVSNMLDAPNDVPTNYDMNDETIINNYNTSNYANDSYVPDYNNFNNRDNSNNNGSDNNNNNKADNFTLLVNTFVNGFSQQNNTVGNAIPTTPLNRIIVPVNNTSYLSKENNEILKDLSANFPTTTDCDSLPEHEDSFTNYYYDVYGNRIKSKMTDYISAYNTLINSGMGNHDDSVCLPVTTMKGNDDFVIPQMYNYDSTLSDAYNVDWTRIINPNTIY